jgi:hypothetical protein
VLTLGGLPRWLAPVFLAAYAWTLHRGLA